MQVLQEKEGIKCESSGKNRMTPLRTFEIRTTNVIPWNHETMPGDIQTEHRWTKSTIVSLVLDSGVLTGLVGLDSITTDMHFTLYLEQGSLSNLSCWPDCPKGQERSTTELE